MNTPEQLIAAWRFAFCDNLSGTSLKVDLKRALNTNESRYNRATFIEGDPISVPHRFSKKQDIEISGLFASILAWGQRQTIIRNCNRLIDLMDNAPHQFILGHHDVDLRKMESFVHRTFNATDLLYFISFLKHHYSRHESLESLFSVAPHEETIENGLVRFHDTFCGLPDFPGRTRKHVATPARGSACKRLNMYLRWMVRRDDRGVDFGLWQTILPRQLVCPCDVHVVRVARRLKLIKRKTLDWAAALELTENLRRFDPSDPVRYDYALFGMGLNDPSRRRGAGGR